MSFVVRYNLLVDKAAAALLNRKSRAGSVALVSAVVLPVLLGFAALAVDVGFWEDAGVRAQRAADQGAIAAALALESGQSPIAEAAATLGANGFTQGAGGVNVAVNNPPASGSYTTDPSKVEVIVTQRQRGFFSKVFLATPPTVTGRAVGTANAGACVIVLHAGGASFNGNSGLNLSNCDFYNAGPTQVTGNAGGISAQDIYLASAPTGSGAGTVTASKTYKTNATYFPDPYATRVVPGYSGCANQSGTTFTGGSSPTVFCNPVTLKSATLTLSNGVFIFENGLSTQGSSTINATNATLIFVGSSGIDKKGSLAVNITAPTSGPTAGMAVWVTSGAPLDFSGNGSLNVTGAIYAPTSTLNMNGSSASPCTQLVVGALTASGAVNFQHNCAHTGISDVGGFRLVE